jgi:glucose-1-phosphatase
LENIGKHDLLSNQLAIGKLVIKNHELHGFRDNYRLLEDVLDIRDSEARKEGAVGEFRTDDITVILEAGKDPAVEGSIKLASVLSDALMLQYYEEDPVEAAFGKKLSTEQWCDIAGIKDVYHGILLFTPLVARNAANPLLKEILGEMTCDERKFTFLCGHDLNLCSVLASLEVEPYELPSAIEKRTPIGGKLVFSRWCNESGEAFWDVDLVYQTPEQLREADILTWDHSPAIYDLSFREIGQNADGLYPEKVLFDRFEFAISAYDSIVETYR